MDHLTSLDIHSREASRRVIPICCTGAQVGETAALMHTWFLPNRPNRCGSSRRERKRVRRRLPAYSVCKFKVFSNPATAAREACARHACASYAGNRNCPCPASLFDHSRAENSCIHTALPYPCILTDIQLEINGPIMRQGESRGKRIQHFVAATASHRNSLNQLSNQAQPAIDTTA